jgi:hypothetical protein
MSLEIPIGKVGRIVEGDDVGSYVKILDDSANTGGFLILVASDRELVHGSDAWVENADQLAPYFVASKWEIAWIET